MTAKEREKFNDTVLQLASLSLQVMNAHLEMIDAEQKRATVAAAKRQAFVARFKRLQDAVNLIAAYTDNQGDE